MHRLIPFITLFIGLMAMSISAPAKEGGREPPYSQSEKATFAGGCFWCMQSVFESVPGVLAVTAGYTGGHLQNPTYEQVISGRTGHAEAVQIVYDPHKIRYEKLLAIFWRNIDPTVKDRQFCDVGNQYRTAIFYHTGEQKRLAERSKTELERSKPFKQTIVTEIVPATQFFPAEEYHQQYYKKNPIRYNEYRMGCGREERLKELWK